MRRNSPVFGLTKPESIIELPQTGEPMANDQNYLEQVQAAPDGPHIGALFDFDGTIIAGYSAFAMLREKFQRRELGVEEIVETANVMAQYSAGSMGFSGLMLAAAKFMKGVTEESYFEFGEELYKKHIAKKVYPESRALINAHIAKGHTVAIISSATIYQIAPTARDLGIDHVLCSEYEVVDGEFTGDIIRPLCFGEGKVIAAEKLSEAHGVDLDQSFFYSDSDDDLELLEHVGHPRVLNPNRKLTEIANAKGWPIEAYKSRGQASIADWTRTIYATGSLVTSFVAGLPIWALTRSEREGVNFSTGLFGDLATALTGLEIDLKGEENLWTQRPAVFVFNHQSKADVMILAKLIRKDIAGIGKQEIRSIPLFGRLMEYAGTVFVDRKNTSDAIKAMAPLVDVIRNEGKSVVMSPEGTRSLSPKLLPFKKGAFHLAMQAGVPMIPIVIHNAGDIAPKNEFVMRPGKVRVEVLPPVDTSDWQRATIDRHVADVRAMFLKALGQDEAKHGKTVKKDVATKKPARRSVTETEVITPAGETHMIKNPPSTKAAPQPAPKKKPAARKPTTRKSPVKKPPVKKPSVKNQTVKKPTVKKQASSARKAPQ